jgi:hypothetical protein
MTGAFILVSAIIAIAVAILVARDRRRKRTEQEQEARHKAEVAAHAARMHAAMLAEQTAREEDLKSRFGTENAGRILRREIWQGATAEMVVESRGKPEDVDERLTAKKTRLVYKYGQTGKNRYRLRITIENGVVTGWEEKG